MKYYLLSLLLVGAVAAQGQSTSADSPATRAQHPTDSPTGLAQRQLDAYNARNIDAFLEPYADDVEVYTFPNELRYKGKETMRRQYGAMFERTKALHCELVNRIAVGNTVIDHERVTIAPDKPVIEAVAIYGIENGRIRRVYFAR